MQCLHCKTQIDSTCNYCPICGMKTDANPNDLDSNSQTINTEESPQVTVVKKDKMPFWYKLATFVAVIALIGVTAAILFTEKLIDVVDHQLKALKEQNIQKAYEDYTSKDFKATTSLNEFNRFIHTYPVFLNNQSSHFTQRFFKDHLVIIKGYLSSQEHEETPIEYRLIREDKNWKILSIRLLKPERIQNLQDQTEYNHLIEMAQTQLNHIRKAENLDAYNRTTSTEFKQATSEDYFNEFIKRYSILSHYDSLSFHKPKIRQGIGSLLVTLHSSQALATIKYYFIFENNEWKVWSLRMISQSKEALKTNQSL